MVELAIAARPMSFSCTHDQVHNSARNAIHNKTVCLSVADREPFRNANRAATPDGIVGGSKCTGGTCHGGNLVLKSRYMTTARLSDGLL